MKTRTMTLESRNEVEAVVGLRFGRRKGDDSLDDVVGVTRLDAFQDVVLKLADEDRSLVILDVLESL
jgi:hypothetical protein